MVAKDEYSVMSKPCKRELDYAYDRCIYEAKYMLLTERFNCSLALFVKSANISHQKYLEECKLIDVIRNGSITFRDIIKDIGQGK